MATGIIFSFSCRTDKVSIPLVKTPGPTTALSIFAPLRAHHQGGMTTDWSHPPRTVRRLTPENGSGGRPAIRVAAVAPEEGLWDEIRGIMHVIYDTVLEPTWLNIKRHQVCCKPSLLSVSVAAKSSCAMPSVAVVPQLEGTWCMCIITYTRLLLRLVKIALFQEQSADIMKFLYLAFR